MHISIIVAMDRNRVIGDKGSLPWHLPADLKRFKRLSMGRPILMGRKTHESIGRPLPGRENIILTRDASYSAPGCVVVHSVGDALSTAAGAEELLVIGGAEIYGALLPHADRMYVTHVDGAFEGDTCFPTFNEGDWEETAREHQPADETNALASDFVKLKRKSREDGAA